MDAAQFLSCVVAPGNFLAVAFKKPDRNGMQHRFFPRDNTGEAAGFIKWCTRKGMDAWYAVASYKLASPDEKGVYSGDRTQQNVQTLKAFWIDIDVKRKGDKKTNVYSDVPDAMVWFKSFLSTTGLPYPNLWVRSGYGLHVYWVLQDAVDPQTWQPYADALKAAILATGGTIDVGITIDSARLLRPPETANFKDPANPAPVEVLSQYSRGDYPNQLIYQALQPYVGVVQARAVNYGSGGGVLAGAPPAVMAQRQQQLSSIAAAQANLTDNKRPRYFAEVAKKCGQAKLTLANGGLGETNRLWDLGWLTLLHFCADGEDYIHAIGNQDPRYNAANTERVFQQTRTEAVSKHLGAPTCASFDAMRPGICGTCPHRKGPSPFTVGTIEDKDEHFPKGYQRGDNCIQIEKPTKEGQTEWALAFSGNVHSPILDRVGDDRKLTFIYERGGVESTVAVLQSQALMRQEAAGKFYGLQGVTLNKFTADAITGFAVAWIEQLRDAQAERVETIPPFGWATRPDSSYSGFAVAGTLHMTDGTKGPAPGGDNEILGMFHPRGDLAGWQQACDFVTRGRPDLQVLVAAAFASPLIEFTGQQGVVMSAWSRNSAVGKSSAMAVGISAWADTKAMFSFDDTPNSIHYRIGKTKVMPAYWDEIRIDREKAGDFVDTLFKLGQGKDKARLNSDATLKPTGDWKTMLVISGNRPLMDLIVKERGDTNAGAVRLFEYQIDQPQMPFDASAPPTIALAGKNAGNAGAIYAAWLGEHIDYVRDQVVSMQDALKTKLDATQEERFYVACISCLILGAFFANGLNLTKFDIPAMRDFLKVAFDKLRAARKVDLVVTGGSFDIERVLANFVSHYSADRLKTNHFARPGPKGSASNLKVIWAPRRAGQLVIHVSKSDQRMRIDKDVFDTWCYNRNLSPSDIRQQMEARWGVKTGKAMLGAGTDYMTGRVTVLEIPLVAQELMGYNYDNDSK